MSRRAIIGVLGGYLWRYLEHSVTGMMMPASKPYQRTSVTVL
jgi:hypothetical protein